MNDLIWDLAELEDKADQLYTSSKDIVEDLDTRSVDLFNSMIDVSRQYEKAPSNKLLEKWREEDYEYWSIQNDLRKALQDRELAWAELVDLALGIPDKKLPNETLIADRSNKDSFRTLHKNVDMRDDRHLKAYITSIIDEVRGWTGWPLDDVLDFIEELKSVPSENRENNLNRIFWNTFNDGLKRSYVDIETTGGHPSYAEIIEVGIVQTDENGVVTKEFNERFDFENLNVREEFGVPFEQLHGISSSDLEGKRKISDPDVQKELYELLVENPDVLVSHNKKFENSFFNAQIKGYYEAYNIPMDPNAKMQTDTRALFGLLVRSKNNTLKECSRISGITDYDEGAHSALPDADYSRRVLLNLKEVINKTNEGSYPVLDADAHKTVTEQLDSKYVKRNVS